MDINRIKKDVLVTKTQCWEWQKSLNSSGYGQLTENKVYWTTHRYAYTCINGPISDELVIRHKCHNTKCCNPDHLEVGSHRDNWEDSKALHLSLSAQRRKVWEVKGVVYNTIIEASNATGLPHSTLVKHTVNGVFNIAGYHEGCYKSRKIPKV